MSLADMTPESVHQAIAEFDRLKRNSFLTTYGFGKAAPPGATKPIAFATPLFDGLVTFRGSSRRLALLPP